MLYLFVFIFGLIIGSFLNVVILRFDEFETIFYTRSRCPKCKKGLAWYDLVPVLSFLVFGGRCRQCKTPISWQYPLVELGTAVLFALLYGKFGISLELAIHLVIASILIVVFVYDLKNQLISDKLIILTAIIWFAWLVINSFFLSENSALGSQNLILSSIFGGLSLGGFFLLLVLVSKEKWMGWGDVFLGFSLGAIVGWPLVLTGAFLSFILGGILGVILIVTRKKGRQDHLPFAPFLIVGAYLALIFFETQSQLFWMVF